MLGSKQTSAWIQPNTIRPGPLPQVLAIPCLISDREQAIGTTPERFLDCQQRPRGPPGDQAGLTRSGHARREMCGSFGHHRDIEGKAAPETCIIEHSLPVAFERATNGGSTMVMRKPVVTAALACAIVFVASGDALAAAAKTYKSKYKFKKLTEVNVTSGTPACIKVVTPQPIAVGNRNKIVRYRLECIDATCSSNITVTGTLADKVCSASRDSNDRYPRKCTTSANCDNPATETCAVQERDYTIARFCRVCRNTIASMGFWCEDDDCVCDSPYGDDCTWDEDADCGEGTCTEPTCGRPIPSVSEWGMMALGLLLLSGLAIKFGWRRARRVAA